MSNSLQRWLQSSWLWILLPIIVFKLALAWALPMTGDEAYFVLWGRHLDFGYYDHPPMAGWMTWLQMLVSEHRLWLRMPGVLTELIIAAALYVFFRPHDAQKARWLTLLFLLSPLSLAFVLTLTDTGCMLFTALSFFAVAQGLLHRQRRWHLLGGLALGLAFLSKYFAVFLAVAYVVYFFLSAQRQWRQGLWVLLPSVPFVLLNLYWNETHCWANIVFNFVNRQQGIQFRVTYLLSYLAMMVYVILPPVLFGLWRVAQQRQALTGDADPVVSQQPVLALARCIVLTALIGFLLVSLTKGVGLHWVLWFYPMVLVLLWPLPQALLARITWQVSWFGLAHAVVMTLILLMPFQAWRYIGNMQWNLLAMREAPVIMAQAQAQARGLTGKPAEPVPLAALSYTAASLLSYQIKAPVMVIGVGAKYARQDDFWTDYRTLAGADVLILVKRHTDAEAVAPWFARSTPFSVTYRGQEFLFVLGRGFDYPRYHEQVLKLVQQRFYQLPTWLPACQCAFTSRYFPTPATGTITAEVVLPAPAVAPPSVSARAAR